MANKPTLIVITPVRNEAWVLEAFLTHCSSWADHIIVADQHSTDGSREICARFPKVTLIDNPTQEWVEHECRARLLEEAQRIPGDKIVFGLDADEFLSDGFEKTEGWRRIMESKPYEMFALRWFNLYGDLQHGMVEGGGAEWIAHYSGDTDFTSYYREHERHAVHCQRVPSIENEEFKWILIEDIRFIHLGSLNLRRVRNKLDFYQVVNIDKQPVKAKPISMYRTYTDMLGVKAPKLDAPVHLCTLDSQADLSQLLRSADNGQHYIDEMVAIFRREGIEKFLTLCIWDNPDLQKAGMVVKPPLPIRLMHRYLRATQPYHNTFLIKTIDKILKRLF